MAVIVVLRVGDVGWRWRWRSSVQLTAVKAPSKGGGRRAGGYMGESMIGLLYLFISYFL
jgi:hypothetical protein